MERTKMLKTLESNGFLVDEGMHYCAESEEIYREVLESAAEEGEEKLPVLEQCMQKQDFQRYQIEIHGIKNVAQTIGDARLFQAASERNEALKAGRYEEAAEGHDAFLQIYREEIDLIVKAIES
ncbi:MAG: hypothetical protein NC429_12705 [Lachnospiraceae bacterium]|nr:hypothetical protein [Lachnospiraceae bacterium]